MWWLILATAQNGALPSAQSQACSISFVNHKTTNSRNIYTVYEHDNVWYEYVYPPTLPSLGRGRAAPGTTAGVELCIRKSTKATPIALAVPHFKLPWHTIFGSLRKHAWNCRWDLWRPDLKIPKLTDGTLSTPQNPLGSRGRLQL